MKKSKLLIALLISSIALSGCGKKEETVDSGKKEATPVETRTVSASHELKEKLEYPAMVIPEEEAQIVAKTGGTAQDVKFKLGDKVSVGDLLAKIDDADKNNAVGKFNFNSSQINQAKLAVEQAYSNLNMARTSYQNLIFSNEKDLQQAEIAKNQALKSKDNTGSITSEGLKSAELAYETAKTAAEQAKINLDNHKKISGQSSQDAGDNADTAATAAADACDSIITGINNILELGDFDRSSLSYKNNLGVLDLSTLSKARTDYALAKSLNDQYKSSQFANIQDKINLVAQLVEKTKNLSDSAKNLLSKTMTSTILPQTSNTGISLTSLQNAASSYQAQANGAIAQANSAKQAIANISLSNDSTLKALEKNYELAKKQEASAAQNLNNIKAGNSNQNDQVGFGADSASNQYDNLKIKLGTQLNIAKSQADMAEIQYQNAVTALNGLYDNHLAISPISGTITKKNVENGSTVSAGQILAIVSKTENIKIQFFIDQESLSFIEAGLPVIFKDSDNNEYPGKITSFTSQADAATKRFLVEAKPDQTDLKIFTTGTVINVVVPITKSSDKKELIILPLSAIEIGQNGNLLTIISEGVAKKIKVEIAKVEGEYAQIKAGLPEETEIIIDGNKDIKDGESVITKK